MGEAELTLLELVNAISAGNARPDAIPGLAFKQDANIVKTARRSVINNLDVLPFPAWDLADITPYRNMWLKSKGYFSIGWHKDSGGRN